MGVVKGILDFGRLIARVFHGLSHCTHRWVKELGGLDTGNMRICLGQNKVPAPHGRLRLAKQYHPVPIGICKTGDRGHAWLGWAGLQCLLTSVEGGDRPHQAGPQYPPKCTREPDLGANSIGDM